MNSGRHTSDQRSRIADGRWPSESASGTYDYTYDRNGIRTSVKVNGTETQRLTFNSANQITSSGYTYDGAGNQVNGSATRNATYNAAQQTNTVDTAAGTTTEYEYTGPDQIELQSFYNYEDDAQGYYSWGRNGQHNQPVLEQYQAPNYDSHFIERDGLGDPIGDRLYQKKSNIFIDYFYVLDGLGSVVGLVNESGALAGTYAYDPFGRVTSTVTNEPVITYQPLGYAGGLRGEGLVKFGKRWYDPVTGRFSQQDTLNVLGDPATGNRYAYAGCNPTNYTDPTGLWGPPWLGCAISAIGFFLAIGGLVAASVFTGGWAAFAFAGVGYLASGAGVLTSCYDGNGNPIG